MHALTCFHDFLGRHHEKIAHSKTLAIGVSGGGDSMALAHMLAIYCQNKNIELHILCVNHGLRPAAIDEIELVKQQANNWPSCHVFTLNWQHDSDAPRAAIQERARQARYQLMDEHCHTNNIEHLFLAHHGDDQYESFLMRLASGSGLRGLAAMTEWSTHRPARLRPLLAASHEQIIEYCITHDIKWAEDPSNHDDIYRRVRFRKARAFLEKEGLSVKRIDKLTCRIESANQALAYLTQQIWQQACLEQSEDTIIFDCDILWQAPRYTALDIIRCALETLTSELALPYPPSSEKLESLYERMIDHTSAFKGATLHHCQFIPKNNGKTLEIVKETNARPRK